MLPLISRRLASPLHFPKLIASGLMSACIPRALSAKASRHASSEGAAHYWFPPESSPHEATILAYPSKGSMGRSSVGPFRNGIIELAAAISGLEPVRLYARPEDIGGVRRKLGRRVHKSENVSVLEMPVVHPWVRDTGPNYVFSNVGDICGKPERFAIDFNFNEWGGKEVCNYGVKELEDNAMFSKRVIAADRHPLPVTRISTDLHLEGGALEMDGEGTLIITESAVLNANRNPDLSRGEIYERLSRLLGVSKIISLKGIKGKDITDCHVDAVVRFARAGVVVVSRPHINSGKEWVAVADEAIAILSNDTDAHGRAFEVHVLQEPDPLPLMDSPGDELVLSYANFYYVNGGVIIPAFGDTEADRAAKGLFERLFPGRSIVQVKVHAMVKEGGGIHCVTQQVPKLPA